MQYEQQMNYVKPALESKVSECQQLGYPHITIDHLWRYCVEYKWQHLDIPTYAVHKMVASIFTVQVAEIHQYDKLTAQQQNVIFQNVTVDEMTALLAKG